MKKNQNSNSLPPKTCTIERLVTVAHDVEKVLSGKKTATRRNGRYADIGEIMDLKGHKFTVNKVYSQTLGEMTDDHAKQEGFKHLDEYKESILAMHPGMKWVPAMNVWVHEFKPINSLNR